MSRNVPGDVVRASLARLFLHSLGGGGHLSFRGLYGPACLYRGCCFLDMQGIDSAPWKTKVMQRDAK